jgi:hypothetical protein
LASRLCESSGIWRHGGIKKMRARKWITSPAAAFLKTAQRRAMTDCAPELALSDESRGAAAAFARLFRIYSPAELVKPGGP